MKSLLITELKPEIFIQGLGLHEEGDSGYVGKIGRHEVVLGSVFPKKDELEDEVQLIYVGVTGAQSQVRSGDILMAGSDELLDRAFRALDEMEHRGVVLSLTPSSDLSQVQMDKKDILDQAREWKESKLPFLCLFMVDGEELSSQVQLIAIVRKIVQ